ncbi:nucleotide sugar dehydrogenase [Anaerotalea alkaliphila]|uniref:Nucleotide sugar dehydrogenase n=1 Tax=Anaerotalea alkaliphila TaxID=2662126 RepID=A0A7X5HTS4_9FIRM|nr:nucleotide sugar dehydrogenase [Anaerotalea alkaliphila]NDL66508.1 nucleotide sugar dehydrogenase [Anaerotalea alkaliphila]
MKKKICVIGMGYIGLPTSAMFAKHGFQVLGVDVNEEVVNSLNEGRIIIEEPYLDALVYEEVVKNGSLKASTKAEKADVFIIAVPTPIKEDKTAMMDYVEAATRSIVPFLEPGNMVVLESTSPPGTVENLMMPILRECPFDVEESLYVAHSPERVIPGKILIELVENNRIIGGINRKSAEEVKKIYASFVKGEIFLTDATTAEMCKLMENTFRDVNIALANELAVICEQLGINAWEVIKYSNKHPRVTLHQPGPGVGGHCLAVDPWFIVEKFPETAKIIRLARETNDAMPHHVFGRARNILGSLAGKKIAILGATYKPDIDDLRESPVLELVDLLEEVRDLEVRIYDPFILSYKHLAPDLETALADADLLVLGVNHRVFENIPFGELKSRMRTPKILDTRNFLDGESLRAQGFEYHLLGEGRGFHGQR